jgi:hypothetical protein
VSAGGRCTRGACAWLIPPAPTRSADLVEVQVTGDGGVLRRGASIVLTRALEPMRCSRTTSEIGASRSSVLPSRPPGWGRREDRGWGSAAEGLDREPPGVALLGRTQLRQSATRGWLPSAELQVALIPRAVNRALEEWYPLFLDDLIASAAMDRLLHHAHVVEIEGHSYRNPPGGRKAV